MNFDMSAKFVGVDLHIQNVQGVFVKLSAHFQLNNPVCLKLLFAVILEL